MQAGDDRCLEICPGSAARITDGVRLVCDQVAGVGGRAGGRALGETARGAMRFTDTTRGLGTARLRGQARISSSWTPSTRCGAGVGHRLPEKGRRRRSSRTAFDDPGGRGAGPGQVSDPWQNWTVQEEGRWHARQGHHFAALRATACWSRRRGAASDARRVNGLDELATLSRWWTLYDGLPTWLGPGADQGSLPVGRRRRRSSRA